MLIYNVSRQEQDYCIIIYQYNKVTSRQLEIIEISDENMLKIKQHVNNPTVIVCPSIVILRESLR